MRVLEISPREVSSQSLIERTEPTRLGNGVVLRAVLTILADGRPRSVREVRSAVEKHLGRPVSIHSVNWCLKHRFA